MEAKYEYKGFRYEPVEDFDEDNVRIFHDVVSPEGDLVSVKASPYTMLTEGEFKAFVEDFRHG